MHLIVTKHVWLLAISYWLLAPLGVKAQSGEGSTIGKISGRVIDSATGLPVEFATISLALKDSNKAVNGALSDDKGDFNISNIAMGTFKLSISSLGYQTGVKTNIVINKINFNIKLGTIKLGSTSAKIGEVIIAADKNTVEYKIDKTVYNVDKDITSQTGVAADVLKKIPEVSVDVDGNVELQGNSNIRFLINGKPSTMFGNNLADVLQSIPASQIQSIEVITSPGAKYDAEGTGGIINIILKKSTAQGINGNVSLSGGTRLENGSFNLNARKGNFGARAYLSGNAQLNSTTINSLTRTGQDSGGTSSLLQQNGTSNFRRDGFQSGIGVDWEISSKDIISAGFNYNFFENNNVGSANSQQLIANSYTDDILYGSTNFQMHLMDWNIDYKKTFQKKDQELDLSVHSSPGTGSSYYMQSQKQVSNDSLLNSSYGNNPTTGNLTEFAIDYTQPLDSNISFEIGAKAVIQPLSLTSNTYLLNPASDDYDYSSTQSSSLTYKSNIYAGYLSGTAKFLKWLDVKAGVRYEYTQINAYFSTSGNVDIAPYGLLLPSAIFSHTFKNNQTLKLTYSRRIQRPNYSNLNPFINAGDPENITTGNPTLQPEIGNKIEVGYNKILKKGGNIYLTLFYRISTEDIQPYTTYYPTFKVGDSTYKNVSVTEPENIGSEIDEGFNIFGSIPVKSKLNLRSNISLYERYINTGLSTGGNINGFNYRLNLNATYQLSKTFTAEAFGNYNSTRINAQGTYPAFFSYNFAIRKQIFNTNGSIALTATNPFNKYVNQVTNLTGQNFTLMIGRELPYQSFGFNFTYKFGKLEFKKEKETEEDNEQ